MPAKKGNHLGLEIGLGAAAIAAAAAAFYFFGEGGAKRRKQAKVWVNNAKHDLVLELKKLKGLSQKNYELAVKKVLAKYKKFEKQSPKEFAVVAAELKNQWKQIKKHLPNPVLTQPKSHAKKTSKR